MTRQEKWLNQEADAEAWEPKPKPLSQPSGVRKLNTHDRDVFEGLTKAEVVKLIQKKKGHQYSQSEETALKEYFNWRLANMGHSESAGTPDYLLYEGTGGVSLHVAENDFLTDEKKRFDRDIYKSLQPSESPVCAEEADAALAAWNVSVPINVMTSDQLASELSRTVYLRFAERKPAEHRSTEKSRRQEHQDMGGAA